MKYRYGKVTITLPTGEKQEFELRMLEVHWVRLDFAVKGEAGDPLLIASDITIQLRRSANVEPDVSALSAMSKVTALLADEKNSIVIQYEGQS